MVIDFISDASSAAYMAIFRWNSTWNIDWKYSRNANVIKLLVADISENFQSLSDIHIDGILFDARLKFEHLPEYIPQSKAIERLENLLTPDLTDDILPNQTEVEPKKVAKLKTLMFSRAAKCSKIWTVSWVSPRGVRGFRPPRGSGNFFKEIFTLYLFLVLNNYIEEL